MVHLILSTIHMAVFLTVSYNTFSWRECIILCNICKSIPLPVVHSIVVHPVDRHFFKLLNISCICNINGTTGFTSCSALCQDICQRTEEVVSSSWSNPYTEIRSQFIYQGTGCRQSIRELGVKLPESCCIQGRSWTYGIYNRCIIVVVPSIIHYIGIHRANSGLCQFLLDFNEWGKDIIIINSHHVVEPGVVLQTEIWRSCNTVDIIIKITLDDSLITSVTMACTNNGLPGNILSILSQLSVSLKICKILSCIVAYMSQTWFNLCISFREFWSHKHSINIDRLSEICLIFAHLYNTADSLRNSPCLIAVCDCQMLAIDIIHADILIFTVNLQELTHEMIPIIHDNLFCNIGFACSHLNRIKFKSNHLTGLIDIIDHCCCIINRSRFQCQFTGFDFFSGNLCTFVKNSCSGCILHIQFSDIHKLIPVCILPVVGLNTNQFDLGCRHCFIQLDRIRLCICIGCQWNFCISTNRCILPCTAIPVLDLQFGQTSGTVILRTIIITRCINHFFYFFFWSKIYYQFHIIRIRTPEIACCIGNPV